MSHRRIHQINPEPHGLLEPSVIKGSFGQAISSTPIAAEVPRSIGKVQVVAPKEVLPTLKAAEAASAKPAQGVLVESHDKHGKQRPIIKPDRYDGKGSCDAYIKHFEMCAAINGWNREDKCQYLAVLLTGPAQECLRSLQAGTNNYEELVKSLQARFDQTGRELYRSQLRNRKQKPTESMVELAEETRRLW